MASYDDVKDIGNHPEAYLIDVRNRDELEKTGVIPASINIPTFFIAKVHGSAIVNGRPSIPNEFPFMAALGWNNNATGKVEYLCGGALIHKYFVLTAAHCLFFDGKLPDVIQIGGNPLTAKFNEKHTVKAHFIHPEYTSSQSYNDIALLQLNEMSWKRKAMLWTDPIEHFPMTAIGYGTTQFAGLKSDVLQRVELTIIPQKDCQPYFKRKRQFKSGLLPSHICAGDSMSYGDTCQGDSGGPLLHLYIYVAGITSAGQACSGVPPAIYTRVASFKDWIKNITHMGPQI